MSWDKLGLLCCLPKINKLKQQETRLAISRGAKLIIANYTLCLVHWQMNYLNNKKNSYSWL